MLASSPEIYRIETVVSFWLCCNLWKIVWKLSLIWTSLFCEHRSTSWDYCWTFCLPCLRWQTYTCSSSLCLGPRMPFAYPVLACASSARLSNNNYSCFWYSSQFASCGWNSFWYWVMSSNSVKLALSCWPSAALGQGIISFRFTGWCARLLATHSRQGSKWILIESCHEEYLLAWIVGAPRLWSLQLYFPENSSVVPLLGLDT